MFTKLIGDFRRNLIVRFQIQKDFSIVEHGERIWLISGNLAHFDPFRQYSFVSVRIRRRSPAMAGVAMHISSSEFLWRSL